MNRCYSRQGMRISISHRSSTSITIGSGSNSDSTIAQIQSVSSL